MSEYLIPIEMTLICKCGTEVRTAIMDSYVCDKCPQCKALVKATLPRSLLARDVLQLLHLFGIDVTIDFDDQLIVTSDDKVNQNVLQFIHRNQVALIEHFRYQRQKGMQVYIGGSLAGQSHDMGRTPTTWPVVVHIGRAHWEVYQSRDYNDPRLHFVGRATSEKNANLGRFVDSDHKSDPKPKKIE